MNPSVIVAAAIGFFIGAVLVWIIKNTNQGSEQHIQEESETLRKERDALKKSYAEFRSSVNKHFARTADAVDQLTDSYKNVFNHLSDGAQTLMEKEALAQQLEKRQGKTVTLSYLAPENDKTQPAEPAKPARPAAAAVKTPVPQAASPAAASATPSDEGEKAKAPPRPAAATKTETPQEAVKRHLHNNREQRL